jgi:hypothetical protein
MKYIFVFFMLLASGCDLNNRAPLSEDAVNKLLIANKGFETTCPGNEQILSESKYFTNGERIGAAGTIPNVVLAFKCIVNDQKNISIFYSLTENESHVAKLWGLAGLHLVNRKLFDYAYKKQDSIDIGIVYFGGGCLGDERKLSELMKEIKSGEIPDSLSDNG